MTDRYGEVVDIAGEVSRETFDRLAAFEQLFLKWTSRINLAAPSTLPDLWTRHILDSAQLMMLAPAERRWLDIGSGGGFPGAVCAILLNDRPTARIDLVESAGKKAAFLQNALSSEKHARVYRLRIEEAYEKLPQPEVVTARALAPLPKLLALAEPWLVAGARAFFHKGRDFSAEVEESLRGWDFDLVEHVSRIDPHSRILQISGLKRR